MDIKLGGREMATVVYSNEEDENGELPKSISSSVFNTWAFWDAHCGVKCICRKRPPQAQECAKAHSLFRYFAGKLSHSYVICSCTKSCQVRIGGHVD